MAEKIRGMYSEEEVTARIQEIADQINRRTEFKVLRTNYNLF